MRSPILSVLTLLFCFTVFAQDEKSKKGSLFLELEPLQFFSEGYSVVAHYSISERFQIGGNIFASTISDSFNDLAFDFDDNAINLEAKQDIGFNISVRYFLSKDNEGWVVSLPLGYETWTLQNQDTGSEVEGYDFWYLSPRIGYLWYPFKKDNFYILGEAIGILPLDQNEAVIDGSPIAINSFIPIPSIGIGFRF